MQPRTKYCIKQALGDELLLTLFIWLLLLLVWQFAPNEPGLNEVTILTLLARMWRHYNSYLFFQEIYEVRQFEVNGRYFEVGHRDAFERRWQVDKVLPVGVEQVYASSGNTAEVKDGMVHFPMQACFKMDAGMREQLQPRVMTFNYGVVVKPVVRDDLIHIEILMAGRWEWGGKLNRAIPARMNWDGCLMYEVPCVQR